MNVQLEGIEDIPGTYPFDIRMSRRRLKLNRLLWSLRVPELRERFRANEAAVCVEFGLDPEETALLRDRDWLGLVRIGANFFAMEKFARLVGISNLEVYARQRGETFDEFMATRRVPDAR